MTGYVLIGLALLVVGIALTHPLAGTVGAWDESVNRWLAHRRGSALDGYTGAMTLLLDTVPVVVVALLATVLLAWRRHHEAAMLIATALVLEITVFLPVTFLVARPRPDVPRLNATPSTSSFPSGHTAAALVLYGGLALVAYVCTRRRGLQVVASLVAVITVTSVAFSRVYRGMHHPTDVLVGALFGVACLAVARRAVAAGYPAVVASTPVPHEGHGRRHERVGAVTP
ncbi:MAG: phosphatase PAP2 family protein [Acidimicrobiia bacterium]